MTTRAMRVFLALILAFSQSCAFGQPLKTMGYLGWWMPQSWQSISLNELDRLFFFELTVAATGTVSERHGWPEQWGELQATAQRHRVPIDLTLTLFNADTFNQLFISNQAIDNLLLECLTLARHQSVSGLHFDFEIYTGAEREAIRNYRGFLKNLSGLLRQNGLTRSLSVFLPAQADDALYDAPTLSLMDLVVSQSYDTHYRSSKNAGPIAPLDGPDALTWKSATKEALSLGVSKERLILTFPLYGYEWLVKDNKLRSPTLTTGTTTTFSVISKDLLPDIQTSVTQRVQQFGASHDPVSGSSYYQFKNEQGQWIEGWFEDWWSLGRKIDFLATEKLGGAAFFLLGYDQGDLLYYYLQRKKPKTLDALIDQLAPTIRASSPF